MADVETVKVKCAVCDGNPNGYMLINASDFVEGEHELWAEAKAAPEGAKKEVMPASLAGLAVTKRK